MTVTNLSNGSITPFPRTSSHHSLRMTKQSTCHDRPRVVSQLRDEEVGMTPTIVSVQAQSKPHKANTHIPMSVEEASAYLKMPMATLYMKLGNGSIPATKPGKRYCLYQDELDKWLETNRKNPVPLTADEENAAILAGNKRKPKPLNW